MWATWTVAITAAEALAASTARLPAKGNRRPDAITTAAPARISTGIHSPAYCQPSTVTDPGCLAVPDTSTASTRPGRCAGAHEAAGAHKAKAARQTQIVAIRRPMRLASLAPPVEPARPGRARTDTAGC